jgi:hypothetical protein
MASPGSLPSASVVASGVRRGCRQRLRTCSITRRYEAYRDVSLKLKFVGAENEAGKPAAGNRGAERERERDLSSCGLAIRCNNSATNQKTQSHKPLYQ